MSERLQKFINGKFGTACDKFCNSVWYSVAIGAVCILSHSCNIPIVGATFLVLLLVLALVFSKNSYSLVPIALMSSFVLSEETNPLTGYYNNVAYITILSILLAFAVAAFAFNLIVYGNWRKIFKRAYLTVSLVVLSVVLWLSGLGSATLTWTGFGLAFAIAVTMFVPYSLIVNCGIYEGQKTVKRFSYAVMIAALVIAVGYLQQFIINGFNMDVNAVKDYLKLGYVGPNTGASVITTAIPLTFYLVYACKRGYLWMLAVVAELIVVFMTYSRASIVVAVAGTVIVSIALCFKIKRDKLGYWIVFGICVVGAVACCIAFRHSVINQIKTLFEGNTTGSGRTLLWKLGFEAWKTSPIFGVGFGYLLVNGYWYFSFHCTPLTYLYCAGALGLIAYLYHRYKTVRLVFSAKLTAARVFVALTVLAMLCNALLDIAMTMPMHILYYSIMIAIIEHDVREVKNTAVEPEGSVKDDDSAVTLKENQ